MIASVRDVRRRRILARNPLIGAAISTLISSAQVVAQNAPGDAEQASELSEIVVTGSRLRMNVDGSEAPSPVTVVSTDNLELTTPSNIPDALNKLPVFQGSQQPRRAGNGADNVGSNVLSLRNFGPQRTLVLLDGHRVVPANRNGTVSTDTLPQLLVDRVDVVTAGASSVYGSDAVTGVVNFILDKEFTGLKFTSNYGMSTYEDGESYKVGAAYGQELFGGRGHVLASAQYFHQDPVANFDRPYGDDMYVRTGAGTASNPFTVTRLVRRADSSFGGKIESCAAPCTARGQHFVSDGVLAPFNAGTPTGTTFQNAGGDGAYSPFSTAMVEMRTQQAFLRMDYDITDDINAYVQGSVAEGFSSGWHFPAKLTPVNGTPTTSNSTASVFFRNNPFLSPAVQAQLGDNGRTDSTNVFSVGTYMVNLGEESQTGTRNYDRFQQYTTGVTGELGEYHWDVYYSYGQNRQTVHNLNNSNYQRQFAALDAVRGADGTIRCYAATQAATAVAYANCIPLNAFGPTAITQQMFDWFTDTTTYHMTYKMKDVGASITGDVFDGWAGPIRAALSANARALDYEVESNASPTSRVDCTGLRICNPNLALWAQPVSGEARASNDVWEAAVEVEVPLLAELPFVRRLATNLAGRHTDYEISGEVQTWKVGLVWDLNGEIRFRGTTSVDIRAPTLDDLFRPETAAVTGFIDTHTATSNTLFLVTRGNPELVPEEARTHTFGVVVQPSFIPGLTAAIDWYKISIENAIGQVAANNTTVQALCESSGGTSIYCSLFERPLPFSDRTSANFPTRAYSLNLNQALREVEGYDFEASYHTGPIETRLFATYQPDNVSKAFTGAPTTYEVGPKIRASAMVDYRLGDWTFSLQDNWMSSYSQLTQEGQVWLNPHVGSFNTIDLGVQWRPLVRDTKLTAYVTVQNVTNAKPDIVPSAGSVGIVYPAPPGQDIMGRYFTVGVRAEL